VVFSHGWPLSADAWEDQMVYLGLHGYRCIAHDRRGHGRSSQPWSGNEMDTYADDLAALVEGLIWQNADPCRSLHRRGEVARYIGRHGTTRVAKAVLIGAVPPLMLKTAANPGGLPMDVFDGIRAGVRCGPLAVLQGSDHAVLRRQSSGREGLPGAAGFLLDARDAAGFKGVIGLHQGVPETDFTEDLKKIDVPTLIMHGDDDQIVPNRSVRHPLVQAHRRGDTQNLPGRPHGLCSTHKDQIQRGICLRHQG